jgi:hypothetical protein
MSNGYGAMRFPYCKHVCIFYTPSTHTPHTRMHTHTTHTHCTPHTHTTLHTLHTHAFGVCCLFTKPLKRKVLMSQCSFPKAECLSPEQGHLLLSWVPSPNHPKCSPPSQLPSHPAALCVLSASCHWIWASSWCPRDVCICLSNTGAFFP